MKKTTSASFLSVLLLSFSVWFPHAFAESSLHDGIWKGDSTGVFITILIESGTLKSIDAEYFFTNKMTCKRGEATFSDGFKGSHTFSQLIPDNIRKDMKIKGDSFVWDLSQFFPGELILNGKFSDDNIARGAIVSQCPSYKLPWSALKR